MSEVTFGVRWSMPAASTVVQSGGLQATLPVTGLLVTDPFAVVYVAALSLFSAAMLIDDAPALGSSTWNCTYATVTVAPLGT